VKKSLTSPSQKKKGGSFVTGSSLSSSEIQIAERRRSATIIAKKKVRRDGRDRNQRHFRGGGPSILSVARLERAHWRGRPREEGGETGAIELEATLLISGGGKGRLKEKRWPEKKQRADV